MASPRYDIFKDPSFDRPGSAYDDEDDHETGAASEERPIAHTIIYGNGQTHRIEAPKPGQRIDWGYAAILLAQGKSVEQAAQDLLCDPARIWRNLRRSRKFRARVEMEHDRLKLAANMRFRNLETRTVTQMEQRTGSFDAKALQWLADRLGLGRQPISRRPVLDGWLHAVAAVPRQSSKSMAASRAPEPTAAQISQAVAKAAILLTEAFPGTKLTEDFLAKAGEMVATGDEVALKRLVAQQKQSVAAKKAAP